MPALLKQNVFVKHLRQNMTEAEKVLWRHLRRRQFLGLKFRRQAPIDTYIVDFLCAEKRLIIELDGGQHNSETQRIQDQRRTVILQSKGFLFLRFSNNDVLKNIDGVLQEIANILHPLLHPPPEGEEFQQKHDLPLPQGGDQGEGV